MVALAIGGQPVSNRPIYVGSVRVSSGSILEPAVGLAVLPELRSMYRTKVLHFSVVCAAQHSTARETKTLRCNREIACQALGKIGRLLSIQGWDQDRGKRYERTH